MVMPYLHFNGDCEEAFRFYAEAFGGEVTSLSRFGNDPAKKVMHAMVMLTETGAVSGSDQSEEQGPVEIVNQEILMFLPSREKVERVLARLCEGGKVISAFKPFPPPDDQGGGAVVADRYGYTWILSASVK